MPSTTLKAAFITAVAFTATGIANTGLIIQGNIPSSSEQTGATYFAELSYAYTSGN